MPPKRSGNPSILDQKGGGGWGPPTRHFGRKRAGRVVNGVQRPARYPNGRVAMAEIIKYRQYGGYLMPKAPFYWVCQEIVADLTFEQRFRWQKSAVECLQLVAEEFLAMLMTGKLNYHPNQII